MSLLARFNVKHIGGMVTRTVKRFPVEIVQLFLVYLIFEIYDNNFESIYEIPLKILPMAAIVSYILNNVFPAGKLRWIYFLNWLVVLPLLHLIVGWLGFEVEFMILYGLAIVGAFLSRRRSDDREFSSNTVRYIEYAAFAVVLNSIFYGAVIGVYASVVYIFDLGDVYPFSSHLAYFVYFFLTPASFLLFINEENFEPLELGSKFMNIVVNYILAPLFIIYTTILVVYGLKILLIWSLPKGGISMMILLFAIAGLAIKMGRGLLPKVMYSKFYDNFDIISIPLVALFWVGAIYRCAQYGVTDVRIYLISAGLLMMFGIFLFSRLNPKKTGRFINLGLAVIVVYGVLVLVPPISAKNISVWSMENRIERLADKLGVAGADGNIILDKEIEAFENKEAMDEFYGDMDHLYEALKYTEEHGGAAFGLDGRYVFYEAYLKNYFGGDNPYERYGRDGETEYLRMNRTVIDISDYRFCYPRSHSNEAILSWAGVYNDSDNIATIQKKVEAIESDSVVFGFNGKFYKWEDFMVIDTKELIIRKLASHGVDYLTFDRSPDGNQFGQYPEYLTEFEFGDLLLIVDEINISANYGSGKKGKLIDFTVTYLDIEAIYSKREL